MDNNRRTVLCRDTAGDVDVDELASIMLLPSLLCSSILPPRDSFDASRVFNQPTGSGNPDGRFLQAESVNSPRGAFL
jgi:hypothetical protein